MRFRGTGYRAHDPRWSFTPLSGDGAAVHGGRFNPKGTAALYLGLTPMTAIKEANQGFAFKIEPCVLCSYDIDCEDIVDLRDEAGREAESMGLEDLGCPWLHIALAGRAPSSWKLATRLIARGVAGVLVPSFAPGADANDHNLVLWRWSSRRPNRCVVHDPSGRLPKDQLSWR